MLFSCFTTETSFPAVSVFLLNTESKHFELQQSYYFSVPSVIDQEINVLNSTEFPGHLWTKRQTHLLRKSPQFIYTSWCHIDDRCLIALKQINGIENINELFQIRRKITGNRFLDFFCFCRLNDIWLHACRKKLMTNGRHTNKFKVLVMSHEVFIHC